MKDKHREVVVITGASAGVGRATAREFAKQGAHIGLLARGHDGLAAARAEVQDLGGRAIAIPTDVAHSEQVEAAAEAVEQELGPVDIWVNNADHGVFPFSRNPAGGIQAGYGSHLFGNRVRDHGGSEAHGFAQPRHDRAGRIGSSVSVHSSAIAVLRRQTRGSGIHRFATLRASA